MPMVVGVIQQAGCDFAALDRIAVTRGPGSFTGLRVGLAAARGIGLAAGKPVVGIDLFSIYRELHKATDKNLLVVITSKRTELFCQFYPASPEKAPTPYPRPRGAGEYQTGAAVLMTEDQIHVFLAEHPGTDVVGDVATPNGDIAATCAQLAAIADPQNSDYLPRPLYLRAQDVSFPKTGNSR